MTPKDTNRTSSRPTNVSLEAAYETPFRPPLTLISPPSASRGCKCLPVPQTHRALRAASGPFDGRGGGYTRVTHLPSRERSRVPFPASANLCSNSNPPSFSAASTPTLLWRKAFVCVCVEREMGAKISNGVYKFAGGFSALRMG